MNAGPCWSINPFAKWTKTELILDNGVVQRTIKLPSPEGNFVTTSYKPVNGDFGYFLKINTDFQFEINDVVYSGMVNWNMKDIRKTEDSKGGKGAAVTLLSGDRKFELIIKYLLYPNSPAIRKSLIVKNLTEEPIRLESVDVEKLEVPGYYPVTYSWIYHDYGRRRYIGNYDGGKQDALIIVHDMNTEQGIVLGNEATGVLKHTSVFWESQDICIGLTHKNSLFPFRKWIAKGESFETPQVFTMVYNNQKTPDEILNTFVPDFVRKYMGIRLSELKEKPTFVYNTWEPFYKNINEKLVMELAKAAADAGMTEFIIDDGWQDSYGDWGIDYKKFPNGLKPVFDYIKSLGMKPGLWVSIGSAAPSSKVYKAHPEWFVTDIDGAHTSLHAPGDKEKFTACFGTGWYDYIKEILLKMAVEYGIEYYKLDFAVVTSAYTYDHTQSGCYSTNHPGHNDHNESLYTNYERLWKLFDELHAARPNLFIDCTFETLGGTQAIDYSLVKHAEGDWLSNFEGAAGEKTDIRVRNMAWWRSPAMPATALVIGNPQMQDKGWEMHIKSIAGALPIMLGDPRKLSESELKTYRTYADWLQLMESKYGIMSFRQDLPCFGEPMEGMWDGFQRINTETKEGGIIGVFRHGSVESSRIVTVNWLDPIKTYQVKSLDGKIVATLTGSELKSQGFILTLTELYTGELFEISYVSFNAQLQKTDLSAKWDTIRPLANPDKGWYHHMLDNGIGKYLLKDESELKAFPGMDHLYLRLAWAYLEPEEGKFDWSYIDNIVEKYVPLGYMISFRISCKETGPAPTSVPHEVNGIRYATPYWVVKAGAKGIEKPEFGSASWTPDWDDPIYLEKLDNFHKAFAKKYDGKPWVRYVDVGSIGDWGEGHTWSSTRIPPAFNEVKTHINLHLKHYKNTQLIVTDDLLASTKSDTEKKELLNYALENGFSMRDDSPMVQGYMQNDLATWTVRHPEFFAEVYKTMPTVFELEHYGKVKSNGYWIGKNGAEIISEYKVSGADVFRNAVKIIRPTYVGFHGYLGEWLKDNPEFTKEILNMCGYWYFPKALTVKRITNTSINFDIEWINKGVAPAYSVYQLKGKLTDVKKPGKPVYFSIQNSGNKNWFPHVPFNETYSTEFKEKLKGTYSLAIQLFDTRSGRPVEVGLNEQLRDSEGYYLFSEIAF